MGQWLVWIGFCVGREWEPGIEIEVIKLSMMGWQQWEQYNIILGNVEEVQISIPYDG